MHRELRLEYAKSKEFNPYSMEVAKILEKVQELHSKKDYDAAIQEAEKGLKIDRYNILMLVTLAAVHREKGELEKASQTRQQWISLVDSIIKDRDGMSFEQAYEVISVKEEYAVLRILGLTNLEQSLEEHQGSSFDVLTVESKKSGKKFKLYFNIDIPQKWMVESFSKERN